MHSFILLQSIGLLFNVDEVEENRTMLINLISKDAPISCFIVQNGGTTIWYKSVFLNGLYPIIINVDERHTAGERMR